MNFIELIHDISQKGYHIQFCDDFKNMVRIEYRYEWDVDFYAHEHLGYPGGTMENLERAVLESLNKFHNKILEHKEDGPVPLVQYGNVDLDLKNNP